ncbi:MAG: PatB family C-S lyase [Anaerolineaceae bacterium]|nr:PatB family C-S lyase [Anaerolineaceae bacterium]
MKNYNFDRLIDRKGTHSIKWDLFSEDVIPLWVADMDFASPQEIILAIKERLEHPIFGYQSPNPEVSEAICEWVKNQHDWKISQEDILFVSGVVTGFNWAIRSLVQKNESVIFQTPVYHPFYEISNNNNIQQIEVPLINSDSEYQIDFDVFEDSIRQETRMFLFCNPHNPVGRVFRKGELERLGKICLEHNILICSDEIHCDLVYPGHKHIPIASLSPELAQNTITLMAPSKTFNIPGLHFSFAIVQNKNLRNALKNRRDGVIEEPNILAQYAARAAYHSGSKWLYALLEYLDENRKFVNRYINEHIPEIKIHPPEGTYLAWLDCSALNIKGESPFHFFLNNAKVALNDGKIFGAKSEKFVRLNFGCPRSLLKEALDRMTASLQVTQH